MNNRFEIFNGLIISEIIEQVENKTIIKFSLCEYEQVDTFNSENRLLSSNSKCGINIKDLESIELPLTSLGTASHRKWYKDLLKYYKDELKNRLSVGYYDNIIDVYSIYGVEKYSYKCK